jgi:hypothetical protein
VTNGQKAIIFNHNQIGAKHGHGYDSEFFGRHFLTMNFLEKHIQLFLLASSFTYLLMALRPTLFFQKGDYLSYTTGIIATAVLMGVVLGFMMPIIFQALLPPPAEWLPEEFLEIRRARIELILNEIAEKVQLASQEGNGP